VRTGLVPAISRREVPSSVGTKVGHSQIQTRARHVLADKHSYLDPVDWPAFNFEDHPDVKCGKDADDNYQCTSAQEEVARFIPAPGYKRYKSKGEKAITEEMEFDKVFPRGVKAQVETFQPVFDAAGNFIDVSVRAHPGRLSAPSVSPNNVFCMALLYRRAGRLTAKNGGFRPGQESSKKYPAVLGSKSVTQRAKQVLAECLVCYVMVSGKLGDPDPDACASSGCPTKKDLGTVVPQSKEDAQDENAAATIMADFKAETEGYIVVEEVMEEGRAPVRSLNNSAVMREISKVYDSGTMGMPKSEEHMRARRFYTKFAMANIGKYLQSCFERNMKSEYDFYLDPYEDIEILHDVIRFARNHAWIDHQTRSVSITIPAYNPSTNTVGHARGGSAPFAFPRTAPEQPCERIRSIG
jgi:hypothetical protein